MLFNWLVILNSYFIYNIPKFLTLLFLLFLFISWLGYQIKTRQRIFNIAVLSIIIIIGLYARLCLAYYFRGNFDLWYWGEAAKWAATGNNIYAISDLYNYFPPWILILTFLKKINLLAPNLHFYFIVRAFLTLIDLLTVFVLFLICRLKKLPLVPVIAGFFLNPLNIIITGFHGQFENICVLLILSGIFLYQKYKTLFLPWLLFTFSGITKHMFFNQPLIFLHRYFKRNMGRTLWFFFLSGLIALLTLVPYWHEGGESIISHLFFYSYTRKSYGVSFLMSKIGLGDLVEFYKYLFMLAFFISPFFYRKKDLVSLSLIGALFFVCFSPGFSDQYFIMPVALGSLGRSPWFYLYSFFASLYIFGSPAQFNLPFFQIFTNNFIFIISICWFFRELFQKNES